MPARLFSRVNFPGAIRSRSACWLLLSALLWTAPRTRGDIQDPNTAHGPGAREQRREQPPIAISRNASIEQGASAQFTLQSRGQIGKWIDFFIRTQPEHGTLEGLRQLTRDTATITYVHRAADGPGTDTFTYVVHAQGAAYSAPATVKIEVRDAPPAIVATPAELDFGAVKVGDNSGADIVLQNAGGGEAVGHLNVPPPWIVAGSSEYRLTRGQTQSFHILFYPRFGRSYSETLPLITDAGTQTHLLGVGLGPPAELDLSTAASVAVRANAANHSAAGAGVSGGAVGGAGGAIASAAGAFASASPAKLAPADSSGAGAGTGEAGLNPLQAAQMADEAASAASPVALDNSGYVTPYDSGIKQIKLRARGRSTLEVSWKPIKPSPRFYRIELRYLTLDSEGKLRIDWRPYAQVDIQMGKDLCTAAVHGLPAGTRQTLRVVAVDFSGRLAGGSATLQATTTAASTFWQVTLFKVLMASLLLCLGLLLRKRWEERRLLRDLAESRAASPDFLYR